MPPKKQAPRAAKAEAEGHPHDGTIKKNAALESESNTKTTKKRKHDTGASEPQKASRTSGRCAPKSHPSQEQLLNFMLSKDAEELCRPDDESEDIKTRGDIKTYSGSVMNPFEELVCAVVLSRPISHRLGLRSIRTILNDPYKFTNAKAVKAAGKEKAHQAMFDAHTQHKEKTAIAITQIGELTLEKFSAKGDKNGTQLQKVLDDSAGDIDAALDILKTNIKGLGRTGLNIFLRRVQWLWPSGYPYVDDRTSLSLRKLGLPEEAEDLKKAVEEQWSKLDTKHLPGDDEATRKRRAFVTVLERAVGADLEGKMDQLIAAAADSS